MIETHALLGFGLKDHSYRGLLTTWPLETWRCAWTAVPLPCWPPPSVEGHRASVGFPVDTMDIEVIGLGAEINLSGRWIDAKQSGLNLDEALDKNFVEKSGGTLVVEMLKQVQEEEGATIAGQNMPKP